MANFLGGYYLHYPTAHHIMKNLQIDDKGVENWRLEYPINDWLAKHGRKDVLAGLCRDPSTGPDARENEDHGVLLITQFGWSPRGPKDVVVFTEGEKEKRVREWLVNDGGAQEGDLEWMSVFDRTGISAHGRFPRENKVAGKRIRLTNAQGRRYIAADMPEDLDGFLKADALAHPDE